MHVGVGVGGPKHQTRANLPLPVGTIIGEAFAKAGLVFEQLNRGEYKLKGPTPVDIRHAQITWKHREMTKKNPSLTTTQIRKRSPDSSIIRAKSTLDICEKLLIL